MRLAAVLLAAVTGALPAMPVAGQSLDLPVMIGAARDLDACMGLGRVARLDPQGDGFLAVRTGPSTDYPQIDELHNGDAVHLCEEKGRWWGIVYGGIGGCGVTSPVPRRMAYRGPCRAGWVHGRYVDFIAG